MRRSEKRDKNLQKRIKSWSDTVNDQDRVGAPKVDQRVESGGYHKPGSNKKRS